MLGGNGVIILNNSVLEDRDVLIMDFDRFVLEKSGKFYPKMFFT